jgi:DNA-binding winged helix-turn-helix (wHTH) protein
MDPVAQNDEVTNSYGAGDLTPDDGAAGMNFGQARPRLSRKNNGATSISRRKRFRRSARKPVVLDNGHEVMARPHERAILVCLHENAGFIVLYETLCAGLGYGTVTTKQRHVLHQHIMTLRRLLSEHEVPYAVAGIDDVGYALVRAPEQSKQRSW